MFDYRGDRVLAAIHPDWTGSPQHFVAGLVLTLLIALALWSSTEWGLWRIAGAAMLTTMGTEALVELIEYTQGLAQSQLAVDCQ